MNKDSAVNDNGPMDAIEQGDKEEEREQLMKILEGDANAARLNPNGDKPTCDINVPLMRYAEVLLIKAEALIADGKTVTNR